MIKLTRTAIVDWGLFHFSPPLLPEVFDGFKDALDGCGGHGNVQDIEMLALYQVTRFGKSKLSYSLGKERYVCIIHGDNIRIHHPPPIIEWRKTFKLMEDLSHLSVEDRSARMFDLGMQLIHNQDLVWLWISSYMELLYLMYKNGIPCNVQPY